MQITFAHFFVLVTLATSTALTGTSAHPIKPSGNREIRVVGQKQSALFKTGGEFDVLYRGNQAFRAAEQVSIKAVSSKQAPPFFFLGCADSRVSEGTIFGAKSGTLFTERNIANQYRAHDLNARASVSYGVGHLKVKHIIVMGHYGCGGVSAAIASPPPLPWDAETKLVQQWIAPIRRLYQTSKRAEVVKLREQNKGLKKVPSPKLKDPGFRALIEENVKQTVKHISAERVVSDHLKGGSAPDLFVHGWIYDVENGEVRDLGVSLGPKGKPIPSAPFELVAKATYHM